MKRTLLKNALLLDPGADKEPFGRGALLLEERRILRVIRMGDAPENGADQGAADLALAEVEADHTLDLAGRLVLPGMINAHHHLYSALALGMPGPHAAPGCFTERLERIWWPLDLALDAESLTASFEAGLLECLRAGVTTVFDHHSSQNRIEGSLELLAGAAERLGLRLSVAFETTDRNGGKAFRAGLRENIAALERYEDAENIQPLLGLHASFTLGEDSLRETARVLKVHGDWGIHVHVAEDLADQRDARRRGYPSVIQRLHSFGLLTERSLVIHGIHMLAADRAILRDCGTDLVHNPCSNANNRVGITPAAVVEELGAGLGTDGMQADMLSEARMGTLIRGAEAAVTHDEEQRERAGFVDYLELLFRNNPRIAAKHFGFPVGRLKPGARADLAIYDYNPRTRLDRANWAAHLLFGLGVPADVMVDGRFRLQEGRQVDGAEGEILARARASSERLWSGVAGIRREDDHA